MKWVLGEFDYCSFCSDGDRVVTYIVRADTQRQGKVTEMETVAEGLDL